ncbi:MAG TPA: phosphatidylserine decarboxylase [Chloroflexia bacterium]|nr:phosphatidylserine decarboxylase [Chloroflexia bacterium]
MKLLNPVPGIAPEGLPLLAAGALTTGVLALLSRRAALVPLLLTGATAAFLRDPPRPRPTDATRIWAAADGTVMRVDTLHEPRFLDGPALRIVTFLSLLDVHINRAPTAGVVRYRTYVPGRFRPAFEPDCDTVNERSYLGLDTPHGRVLLVQIAGILARRIVCHPQPGAHLVSGERIGLIKFGSRTDVFLPQDRARSLVAAGQRVQAGRTPIAAWVEAPGT